MCRLWLAGFLRANNGFVVGVDQLDKLRDRHAFARLKESSKLLLSMLRGFFATVRSGDWRTCSFNWSDGEAFDVEAAISTTLQTINVCVI